MPKVDTKKRIKPSDVCPQHCDGCGAFRFFTYVSECTLGANPTSLNCEKNAGKDTPTIEYVVNPQTGLTEMVRRK